MPEKRPAVTRRDFLKTTVVAAGAASLSLPFPTKASTASTGKTSTAGAKYTRYNVTSEGGRKAIESYAKGVEVMLKKPADDPQNWFRNAFVHLMDCPHGNWWFYVWHRGYLGYFEETIRNLSGDDTFAMPYWDWTTLPRIPEPLFDGVLDPSHRAFEPYTRNLDVFTKFIQPSLQSYYNGLGAAQRAQLKVRGYDTFDKLWNDVTGFDPNAVKIVGGKVEPDPHGVSGNIAYANTCGSRYLTRDNPALDEKTQKDVSPFIIYSGLLPTDFYNPVLELSFNSSKTPSHNTAPARNSFSVLEGFPHNKVHNYIGGVGPLDPGPYGNMTNFLSPVDPVFFLHHSNMDRLWDVWTRKQQRLGLPYLPKGTELETLSKEPFLFYVNGKGEYVGTSHAGEYLSTERFNYDYEPGFGEKIVEGPPAETAEKRSTPLLRGVVRNHAASISVPTKQIKSHLAAELGATLFAEVTLPRPSATSSAREFDVFVGAPAGTTDLGPNSPYYAGTIAFFGKMMSMEHMPSEATFVVPLPKAPQAFHNLSAAASSSLHIQVLPSQGHGEKAPVLKAVSIREL